jgi:uncharacterized membrane protein YkvA (DUF1232 family)
MAALLSVCSYGHSAQDFQKGPTLRPRPLAWNLFHMWKRLTVLWTVLHGDARALWYAVRHPRAPKWLKLGAALIVLYAFSPIDLVPDVVPFFGVVDDLVLVPLAIRWLLRRLPVEIAQAMASRRTG